MKFLLILKDSTDADFWRLLMSIRTVGGMLLGGREQVERRNNPCKVVLFEFVRIITGVLSHGLPGVIGIRSGGELWRQSALVLGCWWPAGPLGECIGNIPMGGVVLECFTSGESGRFFVQSTGDRPFVAS